MNRAGTPVEVVTRNEENYLLPESFADEFYQEDNDDQEDEELRSGEHHFSSSPG